MTAVEFEVLDEIEVVEILRSRFRTLVHAGYEAPDAVMLAARLEVRLDEAAELVSRGCPSATAARILI